MALLSSSPQSEVNKVVLPADFKGDAELHSLVQRLLKSNATYRMGRARKDNGVATVEAAYVLRDGSAWAFVYVLKYREGLWYIDAADTVNQNRPF